MSEETSQSNMDSQTSDPYAVMRDEMNTAMNELRTEFSKLMSEKDAELDKLRQENSNLQRAVVRNMMTPQPEPAKSEQELYEERIMTLADRTRAYTNSYR